MALVLTNAVITVVVVAVTIDPSARVMDCLAAGTKPHLDVEETCRHDCWMRGL